MSFRSLVVTRTCSLGGLLSWPLPGFWAKAPTETMPSIITTTKSLSNLVISSLCLLMAYFPRMGGRKRCANPELCKINAIHGKRETREFAYGVYQETISGRTVSHLLAPYGAARHPKSCRLKIDYFLTVTLKVPTFPLESKTRNEMVCSPGFAIGNSTA